MKKTSEKVSAEGVEVALNPDELDLDTAAMQAKYETDSERTAIAP